MHWEKPDGRYAVVLIEHGVIKSGRNSAQKSSPVHIL